MFGPGAVDSPWRCARWLGWRPPDASLFLGVLLGFFVGFLEGFFGVLVGFLQGSSGLLGVQGWKRRVFSELVCFFNGMYAWGFFLGECGV